MKKERTLFLIVLFAACQAVAQQTPNTQSASRTNAPSASATFTNVKPKFHLFGPVEPAQTGNHSRYVEGLDTRAWTTVAEDDSGKSVFPDAETHEAGLCLLWWGNEPQTR
ncbi:MAG TPA: hypothetical protein VKU37_09665 [Verrucomicrobiae bacterium]|nr:hypothetical protein [Verrucomicrobiae bacterium]